MFIILFFIFVLILCFIKSKIGLYGIFIFNVLLSNAQQLPFIQSVRNFSTPFSYFSISSIKLIDTQGTRFLIYSLLFSVIIKRLKQKEKINEIWILRIIIIITLFQLLSLLFNHAITVNIFKNLSSMSFVSLSLVFLFTVINIKFSQEDIKKYLFGFFLFVLVNSLFQIYQYFYFAYGDNDLVLGLLTSTTQTSCIAFITAFYYLNHFNQGNINAKIIILLVVLLVQILAAYTKGIITFAIVSIFGLNKKIFQIKNVFLIIIIISIILFLKNNFSDSRANENFAMIEFIDSYEIFFEVGPIKVWSNFIDKIDTPIDILFGYGPGSYGSINNFNEQGVSTGKLGVLMENNISRMSSFFSLALSTTGNILWENGIIVLILFLYVYYWVFAESSKVYKKSEQNFDRNLAFGVKYGVAFIVFLYFLAFGATLEELLLWGPGFVFFSYLKNIKYD